MTTYKNDWERHLEGYVRNMRSRNLRMVNSTLEVVRTGTRPFSFLPPFFPRLTSWDIACWGTSFRNCYRT